MSRTFYLLKGKLHVAATGFWYTSGGQKGSFGYYPHLKDKRGLPVYPDTQLHGDLLMAARWATELGVDGSLVEQLFGKRGELSSALLHIGDLTVSGDAWNMARFQVKPRIEIDDRTRAVKGKMLAYFEAAWLDGLILESPLYAGYFSSMESLNNAHQLLDEAAQLLSGFGAFRSRGYGRGTVSIVWDDPEVVTIQEDTSSLTGPIIYSLTSLVNVRSKPVAAERLQLVSSSTFISADQMRGWFVRTFEQVTGRWPTADEMADVTFSNLYPSPVGVPDKLYTPAYPPPVTTLRKEDGTSVDDFWARSQEPEKDNKQRVKRKPLKQGTYLTETKQIIETEIVTRMRNAMEDGMNGGDFRTKEEGGLFVQQHMPSGTVFSGAVTLDDPDTAFGKLAGTILTVFKPTINGCLFSATNYPCSPVSSRSGACLLTMPCPFPQQSGNKEKEALFIGTARRYSPVLGRPRRGRPVILPGSVLVGEDLPGTVTWPLGKNIPQAPPKQEKVQSWSKPVCPQLIKDLKLDWGKITRSQAGVLRELLNPDHNTELKYLNDLHDKHKEKSASSDYAKLYGALVTTFENQGAVKLRADITKILNYLKTEVWWQEKKKRAERVAK
ncbi:MAG: hypothetical protein J0665_18250 [Deltaproteobacteria bacterium]|nr:hypothetical protein [Deltaproteobacteria bacterium]